MLPALTVGLHRWPALIVVFGAIWGASVIADSPVFSTALSEVADSSYVGTALAAQTATGSP